MKDDKIIAKINSAEKAQLVEISQKLDVPVSQLIREGVRDVLEKHSDITTPLKTPKTPSVSES